MTGHSAEAVCPLAPLPRCRRQSVWVWGADLAPQDAAAPAVRQPTPLPANPPGGWVPWLTLHREKWQPRYGGPSLRPLLWHLRRRSRPFLKVPQPLTRQMAPGQCPSHCFPGLHMAGSDGSAASGPGWLSAFEAGNGRRGGPWVPAVRSARWCTRSRSYVLMRNPLCPFAKFTLSIQPLFKYSENILD